MVRALAIGILTVDAIRLLLQDGREAPVRYFLLDSRPHLEGRVMRLPKLAVNAVGLKVIGKHLSLNSYIYVHMLLQSPNI